MINDTGGKVRLLDMTWRNMKGQLSRIIVCMILPSLIKSPPMLLSYSFNGQLCQLLIVCISTKSEHRKQAVIDLFHRCSL